MDNDDSQADPQRFIPAGRELRSSD